MFSAFSNFSADARSVRQSCQGYPKLAPSSNRNFSLKALVHQKSHTGKATKGKVQDIGEVNKVMPLPLPSSDRVRG